MHRRLPGFLLRDCASLAAAAGYGVALLTRTDAAGNIRPFAIDGEIDLLITLAPELLLDVSLPPAREILCIEDRGFGMPAYNPAELANRVHAQGCAKLMFAAADRQSKAALADRGINADFFPLAVDRFERRRPITPVPRGAPALVAVSADLIGANPALLATKGFRFCQMEDDLGGGFGALGLADDFPPNVQFYVEMNQEMGICSRLAALAAGLVLVLDRNAAEDWADVAICCDISEVFEKLSPLARYPHAYFDQAARGIAYVAANHGHAAFLKALRKYVAPV